MVIEEQRMRAKSAIAKSASTLTGAKAPDASAERMMQMMQGATGATSLPHAFSSQSIVKRLLPFLTLMLALGMLPGAEQGNGHLLFRVRETRDVNGMVQHLGAVPNLRAVVLVFLGPECPVSQRYVPELIRIANSHETNAIQFLGVISSPSISLTQAQAFTRDYAIRFPVLFDDAGRLARWLRPTHVPEAFVLKPDGDVVYRGRIDDWYEAPGRPRAVIRQRELREALEAMGKGKAPRKTFARPVGCYFEEWPATPTGVQ